MFERFVLEHIINKNIQIDSAYKTIRTHGLVPFEDDLTYEHLKKRMRILLDRMGAKVETFGQDSLVREIIDDFDPDETLSFIETLEKGSMSTNRPWQGLRPRSGEEQIIRQISLFQSLKWTYMRCSISAS